VVEDVSVAVFTGGEGAEELDDAAHEEEAEGEDGAELDDNGVHLPVGIVEGDVHERFGDAEVGGGTDGKEFGETLNDAQDHGDEITVQTSSTAKRAGYCCHATELVSEYRDASARKGRKRAEMTIANEYLKDTGRYRWVGE
jgi:hypothetical protein